MLLGVIADDFTGASDIANTLARGGLSTIQFLGVPGTTTASTCDAGVVALKSRSIPARHAVAQSLAAMRWLQSQGCEQIVFKYCSTFDSTPEGNIGPVGEALARELGVKGVVACPAFPSAGRTVYQGNLFVKDTPLAESSLRHHPLNPMTDSDIRRWLRRQTTDPVGFVPWSTVQLGGAALRNALCSAAAAGETLVVVDAVTDDDLFAIGEAASQALLVTGGSGIALGLARNFASRATNTGQANACVDGPEAILAGSCSQITLGQIAYHSRAHPTLGVSAQEVVSGAVDLPSVIDFVHVNAGRQPLVYSSDEPSRVAAIQETVGRETVSARLDQFFAALAHALVGGGVRRLVVAGGETSGAVVTSLGLAALQVGAEIAPGVPVLIAAEAPSLGLALKSGNFGQPDFFERALGAMVSG